MIVTWITCFLLLLSCFTLQSGHSIKKRNILQFNSMIETVTNKKGLSFNGYGNYCGYGGSGIPVDKIDHCCMEHDICYGNTDSVCPSGYSWKDYISNYKWSYNGYDIICDDHHLCKHSLCLCDRNASLCFAKNINDYNSYYLSVWGKIFKMFAGFFK